MTNSERLVERVARAADAWDAHCLAVERCNAAIPDLEATKAEREVYGERYRASEQAKRDMYAAAFDLAKWASENRAALEASNVTGMREALAEAFGTLIYIFETTDDPLTSSAAKEAADKISKALA